MTIYTLNKKSGCLWAGHLQSFCLAGKAPGLHSVPHDVLLIILGFAAEVSAWIAVGKQL